MSDTRLAVRASKVSNIFNMLAVVLVVVGGLAVCVGLVNSVIALLQDGFDALLLTLAWSVGMAFVTAITWAYISLATIVAQYIADKSE
jgi:hypothetical protein